MSIRRGVGEHIMKKNGSFKKQIIGAIVLVIISASLLLLYNMNAEPKPIIAKDPTTPIDMESIDSSSCIACHTDENTIASLAVVSDDEGHGAEGG